MKKLMLIVAGALFIGGVASYAQDTTGTYRSKQQIDQTSTRTTTTTDQKDHSMKSGQDMKSDQSMKGWTKVNSSDIPASLRSTLGGSQYSGWEKSSVYVNQAGDRYSVRLGDASSPRTYYFDRTGKPVEGMATDPNNMNK
jgi:hypothetical protein